MAPRLEIHDPGHLQELIALDPDGEVGPEEDLGDLPWHDEVGAPQSWHTFRVPVFAGSPQEFVGYIYFARYEAEEEGGKVSALAGGSLAGSDTIIGMQWRTAGEGGDDSTLIAELTGISFTWSDYLAANGASASPQTTYQFMARLMDGDTTILGSAGTAIYEAGDGGPSTTATVTGGSGDETLRVWHDKDIVFDGNGGSDTISFQAYFTTLTPTPLHGAVIDLDAGTAGANPYGTGTLTLTDVENVVGTTASDTLTGNGANNRLDGFKGGNDTLSGKGGDDTILYAIDSGNPTPELFLDGGDDTDTLVFDIGGTTAATSILDLTDPGNNSGAFGNAAITNFEVYEIGDLITIPGTAKSVEFRGAETGETVTAGNGADILYGNGGNDTLAGGKGDDELHGGEGEDTLYNKRPDITDNTATVDDLYGDAGNDVLHSFRATGIIDGGADTDKAVIDRRGPATPLTLDISDSAHILASQDLGDGTTIVNVEQIEIVGGDGDDIFKGGALADRLDGGLRGSSTLFGNGGGDYIVGSTIGANLIDGGAGNDTITVTVSQLVFSPDPADEIDGGADTDLLVLDASQLAAGLVLDISNPAIKRTLVDGTTVVNIEQLSVTPTDFADRITGGALADTFGFSFVANPGTDA